MHSARGVWHSAHVVSWRRLFTAACQDPLHTPGVVAVADTTCVARLCTPLSAATAPGPQTVVALTGPVLFLWAWKHTAGAERSQVATAPTLLNPAGTGSRAMPRNSQYPPVGWAKTSHASLPTLADSVYRMCGCHASMLNAMSGGCHVRDHRLQCQPASCCAKPALSCQCGFWTWQRGACSHRQPRGQS